MVKFTDLPPELVLMISMAYNILSIEDVANLSLTCKAFAYVLVKDKYARNIHKAMSGAMNCARQSWWTPLRFAINRHWYGKGTLQAKIFMRIIEKRPKKRSEKTLSQWKMALEAARRMEFSINQETLALAISIEDCPESIIETIIKDPRTVIGNNAQKIRRKVLFMGRGKVLKLLQDDGRIGKIEFNDWPTQNVNTEDLDILRALVTTDCSGDEYLRTKLIMLIRYSLSTLTVGMVQVLIDHADDFVWAHCVADWVYFGMMFMYKTSQATCKLIRHERTKPFVPRWVTETDTDMCPELLENNGPIINQQWIELSLELEMQDVFDTYVSCGYVQLTGEYGRHFLYEIIRRGRVWALDCLTKTPSWKNGTHTMRRALEFAMSLNRISMANLLAEKLKEYPYMWSTVEEKYNCWKKQ